MNVSAEAVRKEKIFFARAGFQLKWTEFSWMYFTIIFPLLLPLLRIIMTESKFMCVENYCRLKYVGHVLFVYRKVNADWHESDFLGDFYTNATHEKYPVIELKKTQKIFNEGHLCKRPMREMCVHNRKSILICMEMNTECFIHIWKFNKRAAKMQTEKKQSKARVKCPFPIYV